MQENPRFRPSPEESEAMRKEGINPSVPGHRIMRPAEYSTEELHNSLDGKPGATFLQNVSIAAAIHTLENHSGERYLRVYSLINAIHRFQVWSDEDTKEST